MTLEAVGLYDLGLSREDYWNTTLKLYEALLERHRAKHDWENRRSALIAWAIAYFSPIRDQKRPAPEIDDFMPQKPEERKPQTIKEQMRSAEIITKTLGGEVKHG